MNWTLHEQAVIDAALNGEMSMGHAIRFAVRTGNTKLAEFLRSC